MFDQLDHSPAANSTIIPGRRYRPHHTLTQYASRRTQYEYLEAHVRKVAKESDRGLAFESGEKEFFSECKYLVIRLNEKSEIQIT